MFGHDTINKQGAIFNEHEHGMETDQYNNDINGSLASHGNGVNYR